ncbi:ABC transporter ATP-binding protein [archaeon]|nr:ABC transporter ATP-binding protein [archaeon]
MAAKRAAIELIGVTKRFRTITALRNVTLTVFDGEYLVVLGPTGAGKSTLLKVIAGIHYPDRGKVLVYGRDMTRVPPEWRGIAYFPQNYALFPHLTVLENVTYGLRARGISESDARKRALEVLRMVLLHERTESYPHELSGGMQQRLALARALVTASGILLLDEPLAALDAILRLELRYELRRIAKRLRLTVLHVTHDHEEALSIADRIVVLRRGEVVQVGTPQQIYEQPADILVSCLIGEVNVLDGIVHSVENEYAIITIDKLVLRARRGKLKLHQPVTVVIRPEWVFVRKQRQGTPWEWEARVERIYFRGYMSVLDVSVGGLELRVSAPSHMVSDIHEGDTVCVEADAERIVVLPYQARPPELFEL